MEAGDDMVGEVARMPPAAALRTALSAGGGIVRPGVAEGGWSFLAALVARLMPDRPVVVVTDTAKAQEAVQSDLSTWLAQGPSGAGPLYFPPWDILPHEHRLPHADVVSERLETLVRLGEARRRAGPPPPVVTCVAALLQRTFPADELARRTRSLARGDTLNPLDLIEWLEAQGYEPEVQVTHKGELAWRGGIVDVWPLSSPWPVRLEFFGDELESLREFDPQAQTSRGTVERVVIPPAGELGLLRPRDGAPVPALETLAGHLGGPAVYLLLDAAALDAQAAQLAAQVPAGDPFFEAWESCRRSVLATGGAWVAVDALGDAGIPSGGSRLPTFDSLEPFRPLGAALPAPAVAEARRREFFQQLHRWLRQGERIEVFCTNEGEAQRFGELWSEFGLGEDPAGTPGAVP